MVEKLGYLHGTHRFLAAKEQAFNLSSNQRPQDFDNVVPALTNIGVRRHNDRLALIIGKQHLVFPNDAYFEVVGAIDGERTFREIKIKVNAPVNDESVFWVAKDLWERGCLLFVG